MLSGQYTRTDLNPDAIDGQEGGRERNSLGESGEEIPVISGRCSLYQLLNRARRYLRPTHTHNAKMREGTKHLVWVK